MTAVVLPRWLEEHCQRLSSTSHISNLNLNLRRLDVPMMQALAEALHQNDRIRVINLTSALLVRSTTTTSSDEALIPLARLLCHHSSLHVVHLSYNRLQDASCLGLALATNTSLQELYLDYNQLSGSSVVAIAEGLAQNPNTKLQVLCLNSNRMGDIGGQALAQLLHTNRSLKTLRLANNRLGNATATTLLKALEMHNTTLTELGLEENPDMLTSPRDNEIESWILLGRIQQLLDANQAGRYLLNYQPPPPLGLWPFVLEGLPVDPQYYFLQQVPALTMTTATSRTRRSEDSKAVC